MRFLSIILSLLTFASCATNYNVQGTTSISRFDGKTAYISIPTADGRMAFDSAQINHGEFYFYGDVDSTVFAYLFVGGQEVMPMVIETGNVSLQVSSLTQRASGTPLNDRLWRFLRDHERIENDIEELQQESMELLLAGYTLDEVKHKLGGKQERLINKIIHLETHFIQDNYDNVLGPNVFMLITSRYPLPTMTNQINDIVKKAPMQFLRHPYVRSYLMQCGYSVEQ